MERNCEKIRLRPKEKRYMGASSVDIYVFGAKTIVALVATACGVDATSARC